MVRVDKPFTPVKSIGAMVKDLLAVIGRATKSLRRPGAVLINRASPLAAAWSVATLIRLLGLVDFIISRRRRQERCCGSLLNSIRNGGAGTHPAQKITPAITNTLISR